MHTCSGHPHPHRDIKFQHLRAVEVEVIQREVGRLGGTAEERVGGRGREGWKGGVDL
jgi:hypothetical protein